MYYFVIIISSNDFPCAMDCMSYCNLPTLAPHFLSHTFAHFFLFVTFGTSLCTRNCGRTLKTSKQSKGFYSVIGIMENPSPFCMFVVSRIGDNIIFFSGATTFLKLYVNGLVLAGRRPSHRFKALFHLQVAALYRVIKKSPPPYLNV